MTQRTTVYRVESLEGGGPYTTTGGGLYDFADALSQAHNSDRDHPGPWEDGIGAWDQWWFASTFAAYMCAFRTTAALQKWFQGWGEELDKNGYVVAAYRVPLARVRHGRRQVVFERQGLHPVWTQPAGEVIDIARRRVA